MTKKKIDKRRHYIMAVDTETCGSLARPLVYDFGIQVIDTKGNVYEEASFVLYEIYVGEKEKMKTAYYAEKLPQYEAGLRAKRDWKMVKTLTAFKKVRDWMEDYGITEVIAYNTNFDHRALNNTIAHATQGRYRFFFPKDTIFLDIWNAACSTLYQQRSFYKMAHACGWESDKGNVRTSAEIGYRYISKIEGFDESHTALEDVKIETQIFLRCLKARVKAEDKLTIANPWRKPQPKWKEFKAEILAGLA